MAFLEAKIHHLQLAFDFLNAFRHKFTAALDVSRRTTADHKCHGFHSQSVDDALGRSHSLPPPEEPRANRCRRGMYCQKMYVMGQYQGMRNCQTVDNGGGGIPIAEETKIGTGVSGTTFSYLDYSPQSQATAQLTVQRALDDIEIYRQVQMHVPNPRATDSMVSSDVKEIL